MDTLSVHGDGTRENDYFQPEIFQSHPRGICGAPDFIFGEKKCMRDEMTRAGVVQKAPDTFLRVLIGHPFA